MKTWSYGINSLLSDLRDRKTEVRRQRLEDRGRPSEMRFARHWHEFHGVKRSEISRLRKATPCQGGQKTEVRGSKKDAN